jgi:inhibitor of KinA sporulation pathway (predicted exonuclease)
MTAHYLVVDLEATCSDDGAVPKHEMEIIEVGAVLVDGATLQAVAEFQSFVRPLRHPRLTPFCTKLTTISQQDVDAAPPFPEVHRALASWSRQYVDVLFCSWGDYDSKQLAQDCRHHHLKPPFAEHFNVKRAFSEELCLTKKLGMAEALAHVGLALAGVHHRGIDDARNVARLLPFALGRPMPVPR